MFSNIVGVFDVIWTQVPHTYAVFLIFFRRFKSLLLIPSILKSHNVMEVGEGLLFGGLILVLVLVLGFGGASLYILYNTEISQNKINYSYLGQGRLKIKVLLDRLVCQ